MSVSVTDQPAAAPAVADAANDPLQLLASARGLLALATPTTIAFDSCLSMHVENHTNLGSRLTISISTKAIMATCHGSALLQLLGDSCTSDGSTIPTTSDIIANDNAVVARAGGLKIQQLADAMQQQQPLRHHHGCQQQPQPAAAGCNGSICISSTTAGGSTTAEPRAERPDGEPPQQAHAPPPTSNLQDACSAAAARERSSGSAYTEASWQQAAGRRRNRRAEGKRSASPPPPPPNHKRSLNSLAQSPSSTKYAGGRGTTDDAPNGDPPAGYTRLNFHSRYLTLVTRKGSAPKTLELRAWTARMRQQRSGAKLWAVPMERYGR